MTVKFIELLFPFGVTAVMVIVPVAVPPDGIVSGNVTVSVPGVVPDAAVTLPAVMRSVEATDPPRVTEVVLASE